MKARTTGVMFATVAMSLALAVAGMLAWTEDAPLLAPAAIAAFKAAEGQGGATARRDAVLSLPGAFPRTASFDFATPVPGSYALPPIKPTAGGRLLDHAGNAIELGGIWKDRVSLVSFVYLTCTDQNGCPLAMSVLYDIEYASRTHAALREHVQLVTISFDPVRDPPAALAALVAPKARDIAERRVLPWRFFTGISEGDMAPMLAGFGQRVDKERDNERLNHLLRMYLVDANGHIRNIYGLGTIDPRLIMVDIATLLLDGRDR